ncbi:MAG: Asp-tRNA(Asn)/Glu-tRNA(Gln) amidotransferase GatCAB subunit B, partial [Kiritimatiellae bacterium]|nr:Asp-tRNA(Asn)/Glu-tRNA(Gln) amidotransferase GatCAB subunit B [Kiritimatiellia bacterium]
LPELPAARRARYIRDFGLPEYDAGVLVADPATAAFFDATVALTPNYKAASNWIMGDLLHALSASGKTLGEIPLTPDALAKLIALLDKKTINQPAAKEVFATLIESGGDPDQIVKDRGLAQVSDTSAIEAFADQAIAANPKVVADYKAGKQAALMFLVGQVMKFSRGKANPALASDLLKQKLS